MSKRPTEAHAHTSIGLEVRVVEDIVTVFDGACLVGRATRDIPDDMVDWTIVPTGISDEALLEIEDVALALPSGLAHQRIYLVA